MNIKILISILIIGALSMSFLLPAYSQVPQTDLDKISREADRPVREEVEKKLRVPPKKPPEIEEEEEKEELEGPKFFIKEINLVGVESFSLDEFKTMIEEYENREVTLEELKILSKRIEREYLKKGIIAACFIPPQKIKEGVVTIRVVEARMGELEIEDHKYFDKDRISYYWELKPGEILRYDKISRSLQLMNKNPDRTVKAALRAGKKPGTTDASLNVETSHPIHLTGSLDAEGGMTTGIWRKSIGFRHNNFLGFDDTLISGYLSGEHYWGYYAYHTMPLTNVGTSVLYGISYNKSTPVGDFDLYNIDTRSKNTSVFVHQDLYHKDTYIGDIFFGLDAKDKDVEMITGLVNRDRLRILRAGGNFVHRDIDSVTNIKPQLSQGVDFLGARKRDPLSTRHAKSIFNKFNLGIQHRKVLPYNLQLSYRIEGQVAPTKLTSQEQFSLGGMKSVRGYAAGEYVADSAIQTNFELLFSPLFFLTDNVKFPYSGTPLKNDITGLVFFDYAWGHKRGSHHWTEKGLYKMASVGMGVRARLFNQALIRLECGIPIGLGYAPTSGSSDIRVHFSLDFEDRLPQEIERINKEIEENNIKKWSWNILNRELKTPDSPIRVKLHDYLSSAEESHQAGRLEEAKEYYVRVFNISKSLYEQAEVYVKNRLEHKKSLEEDNEIAAKHFEEGNIEEAKEIWEKIIREAEVEPLILEL